VDQNSLFESLQATGAGAAQSVIVSDYRLDDRGLISGRGKGFFL
jgi:hypothetical protein